jgi:hypothetical protein
MAFNIFMMKQVFCFGQHHRIDQTGQPFTLGYFGVPDLRGERTRPRLTGIPPDRGPLVSDALSPNSFLYLAVNQVYDPVSGGCLANATPLACQISVNGPFDGTLPRNSFRQPGAYHQDTALMKNFVLPKENMKLQFRAEFYNLLNHPNLYVNRGSLDVSAQTFSRTGGDPTPGMTASFRDSRQIVLALKMIF